jgi:hypothetical protein
MFHVSGHMTVVVNCYVIRSYKRSDWMVSNVTSGYDWLVIRLSYWLSCPDPYGEWAVPVYSNEILARRLNKFTKERKKNQCAGLHLFVAILFYFELFPHRVHVTRLLC